MSFFKIIASWMYGLAVWVRNILFEEHLLYVHHPDVPTICVGNLSVGGTGKTPHTEYIVALLSRAGYKVAVLSRGYKRKTKGFVLADEHATATTIGDEPRQMQLRFPNVPIAVCEDRVRGLKMLMKQMPDVDIVVLDDAFQHRWVRCGLNILLTPFDRLYVHDHLLPYGRLREPAHSSLRAEMIVVTKCPPTMLPIDRRVVFNHLSPAAFQDLVFSRTAYPQSLPEKMYVLTGIAQPHYLLAYLGDRVVNSIAFPDHRRFTAADMARIESTFTGPYPIVTTEKDYVRLTESPFISEALLSRLQPLPITVDFGEDTEAFERRILRYAREHCRKK